MRLVRHTFYNPQMPSSVQLKCPFRLPGPPTHSVTLTFPYRFLQTEAGAKVLKLATVLQKECDVKPGDRVLLLQDSGPESILFIYAVMSCGASKNTTPPVVQLEGTYGVRQPPYMSPPGGGRCTPSVVLLGSLANYLCRFTLTCGCTFR